MKILTSSKQAKWKNLPRLQRAIINVFSCVPPLSPSEPSEQLDPQEASRRSVPPPQALMRAAAC